jgi:transcriptional regulator GlxA family with amidase domain
MLAKAGLLGDFPVTMHWEAVPAFIEEFPDIAVSAELFEIHHDIFTCAGGTAALDMMLYMIAGKHGMKLALAVSEQFIHDRIRNADDQQRIALPTRLRSNNRKVLAIVEAMERSMEQPLAPRDLAAMAAVSVRQMERLFRQVMGCSPSEHYRRLRLERARSLLLQTDMAVIDIAMATGFSSASIFSRSYSAHFGVSPRADRRKPDYLGAEGESIIEAPMRQTMSLPFNSDG